MAQQTIVTTPHNSGLGDTGFTAFEKANSNFAELYTGSGIVVLASGDTTGVTDTAAIQAAINAAATSSGGQVQLGAATYYINAPLTPANGVTFKGKGYTFSSSTNAFLKGTILQAVGAIDCFAWNVTPASVQPSLASIYANFLYGFNCIDIGFQGFVKVFHIGDLMTAGCQYCRFENLFALNFSGYGFYFENCQLSSFINLTAQLWSGTATGMMYFGSSVSNLNTGNNSYRHIFAENNIGFGPRGIQIQARPGNGVATVFNDNNFYDMQSNNSGSKQTQAATMSSGIANISVTDGTKFPVDMPCSVSATANGFNVNQIYFVISQSGNTIQLSDKMAGSARSPNNNAAVNLVTYGFPAVEIIGREGGSIIQGSVFDGMDAEGIASCIIALQNAGMHLRITTSTSDQGINCFVTMCCRSDVGSLSGTWSSTYPMCIDFDAQSSKNFFCLGAPIHNAVYPGAVVQFPPWGFYVSRASGTNGRNVLGMANDTPSGQSFFLYGIAPQPENTGYSFLLPQQPIGQKVTRSSTATLLLYTGNAGCCVNTSASATTWTLPTIQAGDAGAADGNTAGLGFEIVNGGAGTITLNAGGTNKFGFAGSAKSSYSITQGNSLTIRSAYDGTSGFWAVLANNGAT